ncbi:MAG: ABC transporter ATP-binding protein [Bacilli bacterium]|nr:ABC transporter ATP-binding protein [Bacilli bacterium]
MKETIKNLKRVYKYGKKYKKSLIIQMVCCVIFITINIILPIFGAKQLLYLTTNVYDELIGVSILVALIASFNALARVLLRRNTQKFFRGTTRDIQVDLGREILKIEVSDIDKNSTGKFTRRLGSDTDEMSRIFTMGMGHITGIITNLGIFIAVFIINKMVFIYYLIVTLILTLINLIKTEKYNKKDKEFREQNEITAGLSTELIRGVRDIKMLDARKTFMDKLKENIDLMSLKLFKMRNVEMNFDCFINIIQVLAELGLVILIIMLIKLGNLTVSSAIILFSYRTRLLTNLMEKVSDLLVEIRNFNLSTNRVFSLLDSTEFKKEKFGKKHIDNVKGNFEFDKVDFKYNNGKEVLNDLSFKIKANETVAFVGKSGVGKTTIFSLLCKLYDIQSGSIKIDGIDINELDEDSIRGNITIISQNPYIFNMSIKDNLKLVKDGVTEEEIKKACHLACLDDFIETLPNKYDTVVGESGVILSGGQRQRLAIARAFIQNTKIILFDEATSALDNETQSKIQKAIDNLKKDYTILIIAHRLSTIVNCDRILVLDKGCIKAEGTHKELLKTNKIYKTLYETENIEK